MNNNYINEHGIIIGGDEIIIVAGDKCFAAVRVAQHPGTGLFSYGIDVKAGGSNLDSFGHSFAPSADRAKSATRDEALDLGVKAIKSSYDHYLAWSSSVRKINPVVAKSINNAISQLDDFRSGYKSSDNGHQQQK